MKNRIRKKELITAVAVIAVVGLLRASGLYKCPLKLFFGIPCPLCGITRAFFALFSGDIAGAFYYHPLWPLILVAIILFILNALGIIRITKLWMNTGAVVLSILLLACFIYRHVTHSPVVRINTSLSLIGRALSVFR